MDTRRIAQENPGVEARGAITTVRAAVADDAPAISTIGTEAFRVLHQDWFDPTTIATIVGQIYSIDSLVDCIDRCNEDADACFLVAERDGMVGFLHYDCFGPEPELHRMYVKTDLKRAGVGSALITYLHRSLAAGSSYILLVNAANEPAIAFYRSHGLQEREQVDGLEAFRDHMSIELPPNPPRVRALVMKYVG
jgi:ribosomal protein S18 acetylase RimI-like enzyme